jgi:hypothetical protein
VLAASTLVVQGHTDIILPFGQRRPISEYFVSVAESGDRKSSVDRDALSSIREFEELLHQQKAADHLAYRNSHDSWEGERKRVLGARDLDRLQREQELHAVGPEPQIPLSEMITCPEPTFEGLTRLFAIGRASLGLFSDEGGQFLGGFGMSQDNRLKTSAALSNLWDGEPLKRVRAGDGSSYFPGRRLSLHLLVQPNVASLLLGDQMLAGQGLLSRMLVCAPASLAGSRFWREPPTERDEALLFFDQRLRAILETPLPLRPGTLNELQPPAIGLTPDARKLWISFSDHVEEQLFAGAALASIRPFGAKVAEHAARLGAVLTLVEDLDAVDLDVTHLASGIELVQYNVTEWLRLHDAAQTRPEIARAQRLLDWLMLWNDPLIGLPEIYQRGPNVIRDAQAAKQAVGILEDHGWLIREEGGALVKGSFRRDAWQIVRG